MNPRFISLLLVGLLFVSSFFFLGCRNAEVDRLTQQVSQLGRQNAEMRRSYERQLADMQAQLDQAQSELAVLDELGEFLHGVRARLHTNQGPIEVEFFPHVAPIHVFNFVARAESGFYDGTRFHRVIPGFMIQGGDPLSREGDKLEMGSGGPISAIPHEFNEISHTRGVLSMARVSDKRMGAGSQFFIMHADTPRLDREYTVFGNVLSGMDVVDAIATTPTHRDDPRLANHPLEPMIIERVEIFRR
ncbi:Peptidyl-prolyl cis-trans isomerase (rotamase) - cyclophilin family [Cyclonatronum proteinivorum]|uniref:Peptidyl-prolyl cis-trans isomerase n=1 Tax=Cyclonatronum proteinivorum TaxID=1457365 RepID=A0A345UFV5_9BACT|nr:peptidylprolyl isomerase [Cyclonatronum proteinivorum]AXI99356.1 Peptidyl-prolyl cis-trans isomerase (rotamase) - cyclophilin family [Cyclonatronum proteinivorum]